MNIAMLLEMAAEGDPDRVVLGSHDGGITASDLLERSRRAAMMPPVVRTVLRGITTHIALEVDLPPCCPITEWSAASTSFAMRLASPQT